LATGFVDTQDGGVVRRVSRNEKSSLKEPGNGSLMEGLLEFKGEGYKEGGEGGGRSKKGRRRGSSRSSVGETEL
jgi:hypothetical protein